MNKTPLIMDVDTGTDDAIAIITALMSSDVLEILAFTTVAGNVGVELTNKNTLNIVDFLGFDIPVSIGADKPLKRELHIANSHGVSGLGDVKLPQSNKKFYHKDAVDTIYEHAQLMNGELEILAVGPLTNVALALLRYPDIKNLIKRITIMGGALIGGNMTPCAEFNIYVDPDAAKIVFESGIPLVMVGLDVTLKSKLPSRVFNVVKNLDNQSSILASKIFGYMIKRRKKLGFDPPNVHDLVALCTLLIPNAFTFKDYSIAIETDGELTRGMTVVDFNDVLKLEPNVKAAVDIDIEMFWNFIIDKFVRDNN